VPDSTPPPWLQYGSGIIPKKFKEIRQAFKDVIMNSFFDVEYLQQYVNERSAKIVEDLNLGEGGFRVPDTGNARFIPCTCQRKSWKPSLKSPKLMD
jgi:hypothetical protein